MVIMIIVLCQVGSFQSHYIPVRLFFFCLCIDAGEQLKEGISYRVI